MARNRYHPTHFLPDSSDSLGFEEIQRRIAGWLVSADECDAVGNHVRAETYRKSARDHGHAQYEHMRGLYADLAFQFYVHEHWAWNGESKELRYILDNFHDNFVFDNDLV